MKTFKLLLPVAFLFLLASCSKKEGPAGPPGNANVRVYNFPSMTFTGSINIPIPNLSRGLVDSSVILVYFNPQAEVESAWYPIPGLGSSASYETRFLVYQNAATPTDYIFAIRAMQTGSSSFYTAPLTFRKTRLFLIPANEFNTVGRNANGIDYSDYHAVCRYYNIQE